MISDWRGASKSTSHCSVSPGVDTQIEGDWATEWNVQPTVEASVGILIWGGYYCYVAWKHCTWILVRNPDRAAGHLLLLCIADKRSTVLMVSREYGGFRLTESAAVEKNGGSIENVMLPPGKRSLTNATSLLVATVAHHLNEVIVPVLFPAADKFRQNSTNRSTGHWFVLNNRFALYVAMRCAKARGTSSNKQIYFRMRNRVVHSLQSSREWRRTIGDEEWEVADICSKFQTDNLIFFFYLDFSARLAVA